MAMSQNKSKLANKLPLNRKRALLERLRKAATLITLIASFTDTFVGDDCDEHDRDEILITLHEDFSKIEDGIHDVWVTLYDTVCVAYMRNNTVPFSPTEQEAMGDDNVVESDFTPSDEEVKDD